MRVLIVTCCVWIPGATTEYPARRTAQEAREAGSTPPSARAVLREASELALMQGEKEGFWTDRVLLRIGELQTRAGDFDGALRSIRGSRYPYGRFHGLLHLVQSIARAGNKDRALEVSRLLSPDWGWTQEDLRDLVQARYAEHVIATGDLRLAGKAVAQIKSHRERCQGLNKLAVALSKSGDTTQADDHFTQAIKAVGNIKREPDRASVLEEVAEAQRRGGAADAAKATIRRLVDASGDFKDPWAKVSALRECAVLAAKLKDRKTAQDLFGRAVSSHQAVDELNKLGALQYIAEAQARVGFIEDALKTAALIEHSDQDFTRDGYREQAQCAIAVAQVNAGDADGAVRTAVSIKHFVQYRDDALHAIVAHHLGKRGFKAALAATEKFDNPSRKAAAILKVATAQANAGDRKAAADTAARIQLTYRSRILANMEGFDYRRPQSWGECYDSHDFFTVASHTMSVRRAAEVAEAAMALAQTLGHKPAQSYAVLFNDTNMEEVIQALARTHAATGDPKEALAWAKTIGRGEKIPAKDDDHTRWAVERRIHALLGVAEGLLDRSER